MSDRTPTHYNEEIDLLEVLETLWAGKHVVFAASLIPFLISFGLSYATSTVEVRAPYTIQVAPMAAYDPQVCQGEDCITDLVASRIESLSDGVWHSVDARSALALMTESPRALAEYQQDLVELNEIFRANLLSEAQAEADFIASEIDNDVLNVTGAREAAAKSLLRAKRVMFLLEREGVPLAFGPISINPVKRTSLQFHVITTLLGALAGSVFVLLRKAFRDRQIRNG